MIIKTGQSPVTYPPPLCQAQHGLNGHLPPQSQSRKRGKHSVHGGGQGGRSGTPQFFMAGSSPPWGSGHSVVTPGEAGSLATPVEAGSPKTPGDGSSSGPSGGDGSSSGPSGGDGSSSGPSGGDGSSSGPSGGDGSSSGPSGGDGSSSGPSGGDGSSSGPSGGDGSSSGPSGGDGSSSGPSGGDGSSSGPSGGDGSSSGPSGGDGSSSGPSGGDGSSSGPSGGDGSSSGPSGGDGSSSGPSGGDGSSSGPSGGDGSSSGPSGGDGSSSGPSGGDGSSSGPSGGDGSSSGPSGGGGGNGGPTPSSGGGGNGLSYFNNMSHCRFRLKYLCDGCAFLQYCGTCSESKLYNGSDKEVSSTESKLTKKESLKVQKKNYREEKKRATKELLSTITDPSVIVMADWLKGPKGEAVGSITQPLPSSYLIFRAASESDGRCWLDALELALKCSSLLKRTMIREGKELDVGSSGEHSQGPKGEAVGSITQPLPSSYLIFRAASESDGRCWLDALELALKCSSLLKRTMIREGKELDVGSSGEHSQVNLYSLLRASNLQGPDSFTFNDSEIETQHFRDHDLYSDKSDRENEQDHEESDNDGLEKSEESDTDTSERQDDSYLEPEPIEVLRETTYLEQSREELGEVGEASQTETVSEENKSLIWTLLKQVRPGMDLSKVVLPTFILEPRSFLDKLSDYYYHADFLSEAAVEENAYNRLKKVVKWYLSGFYKKPQGLKKPYNPILGETFRCLWIHPQTSSKTFYISEQVSHHPPVSAFYVSNRKDGFCLSGSILAKSKFYGNSLSAILDGEARLTFLNRGEDYVMNMPYAHCKGILYGTLTLELGGQINIMCEKTGYSALLEFKLKLFSVSNDSNQLNFSQPFLGNNDSVNQISGKIKLGKEVLATLEGHWDSEVIIHDKKTGISDTFWNPTPELRQSRLMRCTVVTEEQEDWESENEVIIHDKKTGISDTFWNPTPELRQSRLMRCTVVTEEQEDWESEKLWQHVTQAIHNKDQLEATNEKYILEEAQRKATRERKAKCEEWKCRLFEQDPITGEWQYRYADTRPWDPLNDMVQFEKEGWIQTKVRHRTPMVRSGSVISLSNQGARRDNCKCQTFFGFCRCPLLLVIDALQVTVPKRKHKQTDQPGSVESGCSSPEPDQRDSSGSERHKIKHSSRLRKKGADLNELQSAIDSIKHTQEEINR
ncbi:UNVERIFIED_CONTAM: hypothetical protein FKN15_006995 [Acipenser sinensis]